MVLKEDEQQQQSEKINALHSSQPSEDPLSAPPLPPEIIFDILKRLPVELLLRFRSVSKLWCSIISDHHFIKSHLIFSTININRSYAHHRLIFPTVPPRIRIKSCPLYDVLFDRSVYNALDLDALKYVLIAGSCNGLLLVADEGDTLFIWNPSTHRSIRIPNCGIKVECGFDKIYGFGYDESTDDYKVVRISYVLRQDQHGSRYDTIVNIYSLKTGYWTKIDDFHNCSTLGFSVTFVNGAFHWAADRGLGAACSWRIVTLDIEKETYGEILPPVYDNDDQDDKWLAYTLGALGEWLCFLCDYGDIRADIWVMKVKDSWTKLVSIPYLNDPHEDGNYYSVPLCTLNDGKILLQFGSKLVVYDSKDRSSSEIQNFDGCLEAYTFVESLVSPIQYHSEQELEIIVMVKEMVNLLDVKIFLHLLPPYGPMELGNGEFGRCKGMPESFYIYGCS